MWIFLPNKSFYLSSIPALETILSAYKISLGKLAGIEILNPFKLWLVVALITGIDIFGYILEKTIGILMKRAICANAIKPFHFALGLINSILKFAFSIEFNNPNME